MRYEAIIKKQVNEFLRDISTLGSLPFVFVMAILFLLIDPKVSLALFVGLVLIEIFCNTIKLVFYKKRPNKQKFTNFLEKMDSGSFPSIHSARVVLIAFCIFYLFSSKIVFALLALGVILVGLSRVFLKKHYTIDVIAGYIIGFLTGYILKILLLK